MTQHPPSQFTQLLSHWNHGDKNALNQIITLGYENLHQLARAFFRREQAKNTLQPTILIHEVYLKMVHQTGLELKDRTHFFALAARMMRQILTDYARAKDAQKRGGEIQFITLDQAVDFGAQVQIDFLALEEALEALAQLDPGQVEIVELRFYGGLSIEETAEALGISPRTVNREWRLAKAWLYDRLFSDPVK